jgi:hypothetical protein
VKSGDQSVTVVTPVTPYTGINSKKVDDSRLKNDIIMNNFLENCGKITQCSILDCYDEEKERRYILPYSVTSVTSVTTLTNEKPERTRLYDGSSLKFDCYECIKQKKRDKTNNKTGYEKLRLIHDIKTTCYLDKAELDITRLEGPIQGSGEISKT